MSIITTDVRDHRGHRERTICDLGDQLYSKRGCLVIMRGYPASGKTLTALTNAAFWVKKYKVGFFSFEDDLRRLASYLGCRHCSESASIFRNLELLSGIGMSLADLKDIIIQRGYQIVVIDPAPFLRLEEDALHDLAQTLNIVVFATSTIPRH